MNTEFPVILLPLLIFCGIMQLRLTNYFSDSSYRYEKLFSRYSGYACIAAAVLSIFYAFISMHY